MMTKTIYRKTLASCLVILFFMAATGFSIEEHLCTHCGTDYKLILMDNGPDQHGSCNTDSMADCCSDNDDLESDKSFPGSCGLMSEDCCKYSYDKVSIKDPVYIVSVDFDFDTPVNPCNNNAWKADKTNTLFTKIQSVPKKLSGREVIVLNSQFLS